MRAQVPPRPGLIAITALLLTVFSVSLASAYDPPPPPGTPVDSLGPIQVVTIGTLACPTCDPRVCPGDSVLVQVWGMVGGCLSFTGLHTEPGAEPVPVVVAEFQIATTACPDVSYPFRAGIALPPALIGHQQLEVKVREVTLSTVPPPPVILTQRLAYEVLPTCSVEPSLDSLASTLTSLRIVPEHPCDGDSVTLQLVKNGCPPCVHLREFGHTASGLHGVIDWVPVCSELRCQPETLATSLGRLNHGAYTITPLITVNVFGTPVPGSSITLHPRLDFLVGGPACDTTVATCVMPFLFSSPAPNGCSVSVEPGGSGGLPVFYAAHVALGGAQGVLEVQAPFRVTDLGLGRLKLGAHLSWVAEERGARWVVFTDPGVTLPQGDQQQLFNVIVTADSAATPGTDAAMVARFTLLSDPAGQEVPLCDVRSVRVASIGLCVANAIAGCDVNHDGHLDVRDLVRMMSCFRPSNARDESPCFDCDGSGGFGLPDVFCCAGEILRGPGVPRDSAHVVAALQLSIDAPEPQGAGFWVRVHVRGASALDAALLRLSYPADRWRISVPLATDAALGAEWLPLVDVSEAGLLRLAALRLTPATSDELVQILYAEPIPGASLGGTLRVEGADLAGPGGALLLPSAPLPSVALDPAGPTNTPELSPARPNPFTHSTTFTIGLPREANVELAVHDLAGRRFATLAHGHVAAGHATYTWDGAGARDGVYFVRLSVDGRVLSTRVALLRGGH